MASTDWFTEARLGMFVHWGLYSLAARHEWVMSREQIPPAEYEKYLRYFDPDLYDPTEWAQAAADAGMKYVVLTTKHHDGFCLWNSDLTDYTVAHTPHGRDLIGPYVDAIRAAGLKVGFYHSLLDWHHPDFATDIHHPLRGAAGADERNASVHPERYREYLHGQVRELLTRYGQIDYLFFDFSYGEDVYKGWPGKGAEDWGSEELLAMVHELQPTIIVNDRLAIDGDFVTPEQYQPDAPMLRRGEPVIWEACQTLNGSWGYDRDNDDYKSTDLLVRMLVDGVSKNGNLLLNVGPTGRGNLDPRAREALAGIGEWMHLHGRSVYGAGASAFVPPRDARFTQNGDRLYLHLFAWPFGQVHLAGLADRVEYAQLLGDASEIRMIRSDPNAAPNTVSPAGQPAGTLTLALPVRKPDVAVPVIELFLRSK